LTSDGGALVLAEIERKLAVADRLARCIEDSRAPESVRHSLAEMIRFRMAIAVRTLSWHMKSHRQPSEHACLCNPKLLHSGRVASELTICN
jgi:hypothetical protein